jgi:N-acyl-D-amino-acid deacylase
MVNLLVEARKQGLDISYDVYPYTAAGGSLQQLVPLWAQTGTVDDFVDRVRDPNIRPRICKEVAIGNGGLQPLWDAWHVAYTNTAANRPLIGKSVEDIARIRNVEPAEAVLQLIEEEGGSVPTRVHNRDEGDVRYFLSHDLAMIGSDGRAVSPDGPYANALPHPRFYGTYPRILGRYVREEPALLTLESAISKMTGIPAARMGMKERGTVKEGLVADLVIFDPDTVIDNATWEDPHQYPTGIPHVLVSGVAIVDYGKHTGAMPGRVLRRGTC